MGPYKNEVDPYKNGGLNDLNVPYSVMEIHRRMFLEYFRFMFRLAKLEKLVCCLCMPLLKT